MELSKIIARELKIPKTIIAEALNNPHRQVKIFTIPKRKGGERRIFHPSRKIKIIQYWLIENIFKQMPTSTHAAAYQPGSSILKNAKNHQENIYFVKADLENFFPSISYQDFRPHLQDWHAEKNPCWPLTQEAEDLIRQSCFYINDKLAIGYPCSPIISNIVMKPFDELLFSKLKGIKAENIKYTRYADDITISAKNQRQSIIFKTLSETIKNCTSPKIRINAEKTRFEKTNSGIVSVTGLKITHDNRITLYKKYKDQARLLLSLTKKGKIDESEYPKILGHINYIKSSDPAFYNKLHTKYLNEIQKIQQFPASKIVKAELGKAITMALSDHTKKEDHTQN